MGVDALVANTTGTRNVAVGSAAADAITTGDFNVAVGYAALSAQTTADGNTATVSYTHLTLPTIYSV